MVDFVVGNCGLAETLATSLGCGYIKFEEFYYPDGEPAPKIIGGYRELRGSKVVVVNHMKYPTTSEKIALTMHNLSRLVSNLSDEELYHANSVDVLLPWFIFSRQDNNPQTFKRDEGKDMGYKSLIKTLKGNGANRIVTFNPHFHVSEGSFSKYDLNMVSLSGIYAIGRYFKGRLKDGTIVVGRDKKANRLSIKLAKLLDLERSKSLDKKRISETEVIYKKIKIDAKGRDVLAVDDCTSGSGVRPFLDRLINPGSVYFAVIHPTLSPKGKEEIKSLLYEKKIEDFVATNTIISDFSRVDISPEVVKFYKGEDAQKQ